FDFSMGYVEEALLSEACYGVGRYNEKRPGQYVSSLYRGLRDIHMGIDLFSPVGTEVHAFMEGQIARFAYNGAEQDYGYTLITEHVLNSTEHELSGLKLYALHGHLSRKSLEGKKEGQKIQGGEVIAWIGDRHENGGWFPHLHFQLSYAKP